MKTKVLLIFGGPPGEHEVSVDSARQISLNIDSRKYSVGLLYLDKKLKCSFLNSFDEYKSGLVGKRDFFNCLNEFKKYNISFICLHGVFGEDGTLQSIFECKGIKYTGSNSYSSKLCMDKYRSMLVVKNIKGVSIPTTILLNEDTLTKKYPIPCILKPNKSGSSVGISIIKSKKDMKMVTLKKGEEYLLQKYISGLEISCPVLQNKDGSFIKVPAIEIRPNLSSFFDYKSKYTKGGSTEITPPVSISPGLTRKIEDLACGIHSLLGCSVYSRSDFIIKGSKIYYLETNTLPGMTATSLVPQSAKKYGMSFPKLIDFIIENS